MVGITWTDVRAAIPQPRAAEDAQAGNRMAKMRLWFTPADDKPHKVEVELWESGQRVERWVNHYSRVKQSAAYSAYWAQRDTNAIRWLEGWPLADVRPKGWIITSGAP